MVIVLVPDSWEKLEPTDHNPPTIYKPGANKDQHRAAWSFFLVQTKRDKPEMVLDRAITGRTSRMKNFEIREQKSFTMPNGTDAATLLYTAKDDKGVMMASRETYCWVDDNYLLITFQNALASSWRETRNDMDAISASVRIMSIPAETQPASTTQAATTTRAASGPATGPRP